MTRACICFAVAALMAMGPFGGAAARDEFILVQSTTSTRNSGLFEHILPLFTAKTGIEVRVVAVGTGQAIRNAANGDGDVLLVHAKDAEEQFVAEGNGEARFDVMYNDFVIVGPPSDPAGVAGMRDVVAALLRVAEAGALFASRGDDSGTHRAESGPMAGDRGRRRGGFGRLVPRDRLGNGDDAQHRHRHGRLRDDGPGDLDRVRQQARLPGRGGG